jgi:preprotein translocase subunit SecY
MEWLQDVALALGPGQPLYILLFAMAIVFFCYFYTAIVFNPRDVADNLKKSGAFIPGIRPGDQSARYIDSVLSRLT